MQSLDEENWQLKKCLQEADQDNEILVAKVKEQDAQRDKLEKALQSSRKDIDLLKRQVRTKNGIKQNKVASYIAIDSLERCSVVEALLKRTCLNDWYLNNDLRVK